MLDELIGAPLWVRARFDLSWGDLGAALGYCVVPRRRTLAHAVALKTWSPDDDCLITLSVRSAFDLMLRACALPTGSEVLLSALTVPHMVEIVRRHGLVAVPVDVDSQGNVSIESLRDVLSERSRMLVVAQLYGARLPLDAIHQVIRSRKITLVEDCAQAFVARGDDGDPHSDAVMHSFGPIKTATALGGAVTRVRSTDLRQRMAAILAEDPVQSRLAFFQRVCRFALLKALTGRRLSAAVVTSLGRAGIDIDTRFNALGRGFASRDLFPQMRQQPSAALLKMLARRWRTYGSERIERRRRMGRVLDQVTGQVHPPQHSYWVYPVFADEPVELVKRLRAAGYDATCLSRMVVVPAVDCGSAPVQAERSWKQVVFLPWYPEIDDEAFGKLCDLIDEAGTVAKGDVGLVAC